MKEKKFIYFLDFTSLILMIATAGMIVWFQTQTSFEMFKTIVVLFSVAVLLVFIIQCLIMYGTFGSLEEHDEEIREHFDIKGFQKVLFYIKFFFSVAILCFLLYVLLAI